MTNDQSVNGIPCDYEKLTNGTYRVKFTLGQRAEEEAQRLQTGTFAKFEYCDCSSFGVVSEIIWRHAE